MNSKEIIERASQILGNNKMLFEGFSDIMQVQDILTSSHCCGYDVGDAAILLKIPMNQFVAKIKDMGFALHTEQNLESLHVYTYKNRKMTIEITQFNRGNRSRIEVEFFE